MVMVKAVMSTTCVDVMWCLTSVVSVAVRWKIRRQSADEMINCLSSWM